MTESVGPRVSGAGTGISARPGTPLLTVLRDDLADELDLPVDRERMRTAHTVTGQEAVPLRRQ